MMGLRVGAFLMAKKRGIKFASPKLTHTEELTNLCEEKYLVKDRDILENSKAKLKFRKYPYPEWCGGLWLILMGLFVLWVLNTEMAEVEQSWFQWIGISGLIIAGTAFMISGQTICTEFEGRKEDGTLLITKSNILL